MQQPLARYVAAEVRAELARRPMSWGQLAAALGKSEMWVRRRLHENATQEISFTELEEIGAALDVPASRFLPADERAAAS